MRARVLVAEDDAGVRCTPRGLLEMEAPRKEALP